MKWRKNCDQRINREIDELINQADIITNLNHQFSKKYLIRKEYLLQQVSKKEYIRRKKVKRLLKAVAMIVAGLITIPTTVYAAARLYNIYVVREGYRTQYSIDQLQSVDKSAKVPLSLKLSYLPEGMIDIEDGVKYSYQATRYQGGLTFCIYKLKDQDESVLTSYYSESYETIEVNGRPGVIIWRVDNFVETGISFDKEIVILFEELGYILQAYIGEDLSKEEALLVANGLELIITDEDTATFPVSSQKDLPTKDEINEKDEYRLKEMESPDSSYYTNIDKSSIIEVNEPCVISPLGKKERFSLVIEGISIHDTINGIDQSKFFDYEGNIKPYINEDGTIKGYERKWMKYGNGITSKHEVLSTEYVNSKYVEITVRITNLQDVKIRDVFMLPELLLLEEAGDGLQICLDNYVGNHFFRGIDAFEYFDQPQFIEKSERNHYFFRDLEAREELEYNLGMFVDEDHLDNMFLRMTNEEWKEIYIDIRQ